MYRITQALSIGRYRMNTFPIAYLNGRMLPFDRASLPLHDAGLVSGATVVDNARTFKHQLFRWPDHLARFRRDCRDCFIPLAATDEQLTSIAEEIIAHNGKLLSPVEELQLVTFATPGPLGFYLGKEENGPPTLGMVSYPLPAAKYRRFHAEGVSLAVSGMQSSDSTDLLSPRIKHRSRLFWHIAERSIRDPESPFHGQGSVPVVLSTSGVGDTSIGGVLAVVGNTVIAPMAGTVQESISMKVVDELCTRLKLKFEERYLDLRNLKDVSELLLAGTGFCVAGVREFSYRDAKRSFTWPGPVYRQLVSAWSDLVGVDVTG